MSESRDDETEPAFPPLPPGQIEELRAAARKSAPRAVLVPALTWETAEIAAQEIACHDVAAHPVWPFGSDSASWPAVEIRAVGKSASEILG